MAYPIRFFLVNKKTGEQVLATTAQKNNHVGISAILFPDGSPAIMEDDGWHTFINKVSCADYELHVATTKIDGQWHYEQIGF